MAIDITMPALSPTMESGTLAKWLVGPGDRVKSGDLLCEIETDKATMEFEAIDEGEVVELVVAEGAEEVKVGAVILRLKGEDEGEGPAPVKAESKPEAKSEPVTEAEAPPHPATPAAESPPASAGAGLPARGEGNRIIASPLAKRVAAAKGVDLGSISGSGPKGRIVLADVEAAGAAPAKAEAAPVKAEAAAAAPAPAPAAKVEAFVSDIPHSIEKLGNVRKVIARRLTEAKATIPHIYLTLDVRLDALLKLRGELNAALEGRGIKLSVNDMVIKALALGLRQVPKCNVSFAAENLVSYDRADISVAVAAPSGLITPIIVGADAKPMSVIASEMKVLAEKARAGKLQPHEYQGGTASLSNLGMFGIKAFDAVINPPQGMILAVGAGEKRAVVEGDAVVVATVMSITGSFDHRAIDGADGAELMQAVKALIEKPLGLVA
ncbi:acetyltransferase component of pyruvate dehydrogenase complex [Polymorphobacter multimanifer]|uniref:Acetyltransferase component of pyruvate dehydrogenase complex n=1 Tax=Polymorphobacter multimanifer TaxID=1070431 RepID=A0A841L872_9SPHN|nr:pyruvate dehydrogenase complex dihydrolipoamide acetyltransferase [Polymorphobacter multimanifer]MBB6226055.1 pyruvate dehydrogenase E2 component (dihydrolipoamide acetyltransferase) [Polymorphobacter multimanifer]GGI83858.1 acetyltransferase component of pyruvate dehydrogenase complex [Polymorphobacter multimanifer]